MNLNFSPQLAGPLIQQCENGTVLSCGNVTQMQSVVDLSENASCVLVDLTELNILLIACIVSAFLVALVIAVLLSVICWMTVKIRRLKSSVGGKDGANGGILENPTYNDLPMNDVVRKDSAAGYHEITSKGTAASYETVPSHQKPLANYDDVAVDDYHPAGGGEATKNKFFKVSNQPSSAQAPVDNYDDVILPNHDVAGQEKAPKGYGKPPAPPPTENYSVVTKCAKVVVQNEGPMEYNRLLHEHQHAASASTARNQECYSTLTDPRQYSLSVGQRPQQQGGNDSSYLQSAGIENGEGAVHERVYLNETRGAGDLYCNTVSEEEAALYMNVKH